MSESGKRKQSGSSSPMPTGLHTARSDPEEHHGKGQTERVGELARHGREQVAAVDVEAAVEQERDRGDRHQARPGECQAAEFAHRPGSDRKGHHAGDDDQLHCCAVVDRHDHYEADCGDCDEGGVTGGSGADAVASQHKARAERASCEDRHPERAAETHVDHHDQQRRDHHVEGEGREPGVPVGRPSRETKLRQQDIAQVRRRPDMGAHIAPGRRGVVEPEVRLDVPGDEDGRHGDEHEGGDLLRRDRADPRPPPPRLGLEVDRRGLVVGRDLDVGLEWRLVRHGADHGATKLAFLRAARTNPPPLLAERTTRPRRVNDEAGRRTGQLTPRAAARLW